MDAQKLVQELLINEYAKALARNPSFSQRAFAIRLGLSSGALSSIINGNRKVSYKLASNLVDKLAVSPDERSRILGSFSKHVEKLVKSKASKERQLSMDQFQLISKGIHFTLLSLIETGDPLLDYENLSIRLNKSKREVKAAIVRLERLGLISHNKNGEFVYDGSELSSPHEVSSDHIKNSHIESMEDAKDSLFKDNINQRNFTSQTLAINLDKLSEAKNLIRKFEDEFAALMAESEKKNEVFKINIQFFPMTRTAQ